ncbi:MAG: hypothetical protein Q9169_007683 [Polycauliona sp. 2 TL-2023]
MQGIELFIHYNRRADAPADLTRTELKQFLAPLLKYFQIINFDVKTFKNGIDASLTTHKRTKALVFLEWYRKLPYSRKLLRGSLLEIRKSKHEAEVTQVRVLEREEIELLKKGGGTVEALALAIDRRQRECKVSSFAYGKWEYAGSQVYYHPYLQKSLDATVTFGDHYLVLKWEATPGFDDHDSGIWSSINSTNESLRIRIQFPYSAMESSILDDQNSLSLICTVNQSPKIWVDDVRNYEADEYICSCQDYQFEFQDASDVKHLLGLVHDGVVPHCSLQPVMVLRCNAPLKERFEDLELALEKPCYGFDFSVIFQLTKLARNGFLSPRTVLNIIGPVATLQGTVGATRVAAALQRLCQHIPYAGPFVDASEHSPLAVSTLLASYVEELAEEQDYLNHMTEIMTTYKVIITPSALQLAGPEPECSNRVLRNYADFSHYFLRVLFADEDGEPLYYDSKHTNAEIFDERFSGLLHNGIKICGRTYQFTGFSHSSLRGQTCWFLEPFMQNDTLIDADTLIFNLGDFTHIRVPARAAARIGQTFTDTSHSIAIDPDIVEEIEDVERNGHMFSDGVGTCSLQVLKLLQATRKPFSVPATVFQIRYAGAKGVISLDDRLPGYVLRLRPSMIKFRGTGESNVEICGKASRKIPLVLNRSLIQILEDLKIPHQAFKDLQDRAINELRSGVSSVSNAAAILEKSNIGGSTHTPWLLRKMQGLGLALDEDVFFRDLLDAVILIQLQDLKYKTRLPVDEGGSFYGIMDETEFLEEGEIYCCWIDRQGQTKNASGTLARAVEVPDDSPLRALHNCVVFSAKGERDLPSQLSGGDLDGDLFQVIWDKTLIPAACVEPSDYSKPLLDELDRQVTRRDMSDHFITFMKNDVLGRVSTLHMVLADQSVLGTMDEDCKLLATLFSSAVDFSKTVLSVSPDQFPSSKSSMFRPDFMAPGRKITIEAHGITVEDEHIDLMDRDDPRKAGESGRKRYYESTKILGILYRSINECAFFKELHEISAIMKDDGRTTEGVLPELWEYVCGEVGDLAWEDFKPYAAAMRDSYEAAVRNIILQYSTNPPEYLEEIEVFIGSIICRTGKQSKRQKEFNKGMKEKYDEEARAYMAAMRDCTGNRDLDGSEGSQNSDNNNWEGLHRSMACLYVAIFQSRASKGRMNGCRTDTFGWIAAAAVMRELEDYQEERDVGPLKRAQFRNLRL